MGGRIKAIYSKFSVDDNEYCHHVRVCVHLSAACCNFPHHTFALRNTGCASRARVCVTWTGLAGALAVNGLEGASSTGHNGSAIHISSVTSLWHTLRAIPGTHSCSCCKPVSSSSANRAMMAARGVCQHVSSHDLGKSLVIIFVPMYCGVAHKTRLGQVLHGRARLAVVSCGMPVEPRQQVIARRLVRLMCEVPSRGIKPWPRRTTARHVGVGCACMRVCVCACQQM